MPRVARHCILTALGLCAIAAAAAPRPAYAGVTKPACDAIEPWALAIDPKDRWHPNPAQRFWLPSSFQGPPFEALFGEPVTEWTLDDVTTVQSLLHECMKAASKAKRYQEQKAFNTARAFVSGNLKAYIAQNARAGEKHDKDLEALLNLPDSPQLLQVLVRLRHLEAGNKNALRNSERQIMQIGGTEAKAARPIVIAAYRQTPGDFSTNTLPRLDERFDALRATYLRQAEDRLAAHRPGPAGLADVDAVLSEIRANFGFGLSAQDYARLQEVAEGERVALRREILDKAKARIDALPMEPASISEAAAIAARASPSLDADGENALQSHATARRHAIAGALLAEAEQALASFPATLAGIDELNRRVSETLRAVSDHLEETRIESFRKHASARRSAMAEQALPEFERLTAALGNDPQGLEALNAQAGEIEAWDGLAPDIRAAYQGVVAERRAAIENSIAKAAEAREKDRQRMVVSAAKARIDALPADFGSLDKVTAEVKAARGKKLSAAAVAELESHAAARRRALADEILALAAPKLREGSETIEGFAQLHDIIDVVLEETKSAATPSAVEAFEETATEVSTELGRTLFDRFGAELAGLSKDRDGLEKARQATRWAETLRYIEDDLRDDYVSAARDRRDEIAAAGAERRERVLAAGGDPELVGYRFADEHGLSSIEFVDEKRAIFSAVGLRFGATYEVVGDDIFIEGPNGTLVLGRNGNELHGNGLRLKRVEK